MNKLISIKFKIVHPFRANNNPPLCIASGNLTHDLETTSHSSHRLAIPIFSPSPFPRYHVSRIPVVWKGGTRREVSTPAETLG